MRLRGICFHNLRDLDVNPAAGDDTSRSPAVAGSSKSTLVVESPRRCRQRPSRQRTAPPSQLISTDDDADTEIVDVDHDASVGVTVENVDAINRLVSVDQRRSRRTHARRWRRAPVCSTPCAANSPLPRRPVAAAGAAKQFSFNVAEGRCPTCQGEGFVSVELLFLPGAAEHARPVKGARYSDETTRSALPRSNHRRCAPR